MFDRQRNCRREVSLEKKLQDRTPNLWQPPYGSWEHVYLALYEVRKSEPASNNADSAWQLLFVADRSMLLLEGHASNDTPTRSTEEVSTKRTKGKASTSAHVEQGPQVPRTGSKQISATLETSDRLCPSCHSLRPGIARTYQNYYRIAYKKAGICCARQLARHLERRWLPSWLLNLSSRLTDSLRPLSIASTHPACEWRDCGTKALTE